MDEVIEGRSVHELEAGFSFYPIVSSQGLSFGFFGESGDFSLCCNGFWENVCLNGPVK